MAKRRTIHAAKTPARQFGAMHGRARTGRAFFERLPADELARWGE